MGGEIVGEFLMSTGYLPGAHHEACPVHREIVKLSPPWMRGSGRLLQSSPRPPPQPHPSSSCLSRGRSESRRVGKGCVRSCRYWLWPDLYNIYIHNINMHIL